MADVLSMPERNPDRAGFLVATTAEIASLRDMKTWDPDEQLDVADEDVQDRHVQMCLHEEISP